MNAAQIRSTLAALEQLPGLEAPADLYTLPERGVLGPPGVAIVGMISRGKSVLFNRLVGAELSETADEPATASGLVASFGPPGASAIRSDGKQVELPKQPAAIRKALRRASGQRYSLAFVTGEFRLPPGLVLIDTPGLGDPGGQIDASLTHVADSWRRAGAGGVVVVASVPPGFAGADIRFIQEAQATFPDAIAVCLKRTSRDVDPKDVEEVAADARERLGIDPLVLADEEPVEPWGSGPLAILENRISELSRAAAARVAPDRDRFALHVADATAQLAQRVMAVEDLRRAKDAGGGGDPGLLTAIAAALDKAERRHQQVIAEAERAASHADQAAHNAILDGSAARLEQVLTSAATSEIRRTCYAELATLAAKGSPLARRLISPLLQDPTQLQQSGLTGVRLADSLDPEELSSAIEKGKVGEDVLWQLANRTGQDQLTNLAAARLIKLSESHGDADSLARLASLGDPRVRQLAKETRGRVLLGTLRTAVAASDRSDPEHYRQRVDRADKALEGWLAGTDANEPQGKALAQERSVVLLDSVAVEGRLRLRQLSTWSHRAPRDGWKAHTAELRRLATAAETYLKGAKSLLPGPVIASTRGELRDAVRAAWQSALSAQMRALRAAVGETSGAARWYASKIRTAHADLESTFTSAPVAGVPIDEVERAILETSKLTRDATAHLEPLLAKGFVHLYSSEQDRSQFETERKLLEDNTLWFMANGDLNPSCHAAVWLEFSRAHGVSWPSVYDSAVHAAKLRAEAERKRWRSIYGWSFAGWALSFALLGEAGSVAFVIWACSFAAWLMAKERRNVTPAWEQYLELPNVDPNLKIDADESRDDGAEVCPQPVLVPSGWYPDPRGRHEIRYWDGEQWTEHVSDDGGVTRDAL